MPCRVVSTLASASSPWPGSTAPMPARAIVASMRVLLAAIPTVQAPHCMLTVGNPYVESTSQQTLACCMNF